MEWNDIMDNIYNSWWNQLFFTDFKFFKKHTKNKKIEILFHKWICITLKKQTTFQTKSIQNSKMNTFQTNNNLSVQEARSGSLSFFTNEQLFSRIQLWENSITIGEKDIQNGTRLMNQGEDAVEMAQEYLAEMEEEFNNMEMDNVTMNDAITTWTNVEKGGNDDIARGEELVKKGEELIQFANERVKESRDEIERRRTA